MGQESFMTWVNFKELREELDFREVLRHYGVQINTGSRLQYHGKCPLPTHQGQRKGTSFSAHLERGIWKCFGCGAQGNVLDFACRMEKLDPARPDDIRKIALILADRYRITSEKPAAAPPKKPAPPTSMPKLVNAPLDFSLKDLDPDHPYLLGRGFTKATIERFELGFCSRGLMKDRVAIPLRDSQGRLIGYAGRVVDDAAITEENPKYRFPAAREREGKRYEFSKGLFLYNGQPISSRPAEELIIVEGFPATLVARTTWIQSHRRFDESSATISAEQIELIVGMVPRRGRIWILRTDGDQAGQYCAEGLLKQSPHRTAWCDGQNSRMGESPSIARPTNYGRGLFDSLAGEKRPVLYFCFLSDPRGSLFHIPENPCDSLLQRMGEWALVVDRALIPARQPETIQARVGIDPAAQERIDKVITVRSRFAKLGTARERLSRDGQFRRNARKGGCW